MKTEQKTIETPLDILLLRGARLDDDTVYLKGLGLTMESLLRCKRLNVPVAEIEKMVGSASTDTKLEVSIYTALANNVKTVQEIVEDFWLVRSSWVPSLTNLFKAELIEIFERTDDDTKFEAIEIDSDLIERTTNVLTNSRTGMIHYGPFLHQLNLLIKHTRGLNIGLLLLGFVGSRNKQPIITSDLTVDELAMVAYEVKAIPKFSGIIGHYKTEIGIAYLDVSFKELRTAAKRVAEALPFSTLELAVASADNMQVCIGCAHYPRDCANLAELLGASEKALSLSMNSSGGIVSALDM